MAEEQTQAEHLQGTQDEAPTTRDAESIEGRVVPDQHIAQGPEDISARFDKAKIFQKQVCFNCFLHRVQL